MKTNSDSSMGRVFSRSVSERSARVTLFIFFGLLVFSTAFFVFADNDPNSKNVFQDSDQDGLSNDEEKLYGTDPFNRDTDGDGYSDGVEVESGYDPLKRAPGDKIVENTSSDQTAAADDLSQKNLTKQASQELASTIKSSSDSNEPLTMEQMNASVQKIMETSSQEIVLPDVDIKDIKIKAAPSKKLSDKKRKEQERQDATEYLTTLSYIVANNSPRSFHTENELQGILSTLTSESMAAISLGNSSYINQIAETGENIIKESKSIEVPESMLDLHVRALRIAKYAVSLKSELSVGQGDPLGQIAGLSKLQGLLGVVTSFSSEFQQKLAEYGINKIPVDL